jgi:radical SAM-linked protein
MSRFMSRLITKSKIPVWFTEGFNQHIYMNFALPLSLGFESNYEIMEFRLIDDDYPLDSCLDALNSVCPNDISFFAISDGGSHMKEIGFAKFILTFDELSDSVSSSLKEFLNRDSIICLKKGKKGKFKEIDLIPKIKEFEVIGNTVSLTLIAGTEDNLNPSLVLSTFFEQTATEPIYYSVIRTEILNKEGKLFA